MKVKLALYALLLTSTLRTADAQVLMGDPQFSALRDIGWGMSMREIKNLYEKNQISTSVTDSSLTLKTEFFGVQAPTEIRFQQSRQGPAFIRIKFGEASKALVDTIRSHFTRFTRKEPTTTATEKKLLIINIRIEAARWKTEKESVVLTTALRDGVVGDVGLIISKAAD